MFFCVQGWNGMEWYWQSTKGILLGIIVEIEGKARDVFSILTHRCCMALKSAMALSLSSSLTGKAFCHCLGLWLLEALAIVAGCWSLMGF